ncbi:ParB/RepB/Spo0J family partition protein [Salinisphaera orenii]|uniref:Probable chromosome-partitioning protein ParB n=1 Tax=Salinisphaera orenii YIM 95161 TaxID=1051139 RepID=A0A423Q363_9GAMM|nr:ParB/RepB/Spo0J family partition protein [Salinisphaera halophila]ROO32973.1 chromosome partitioning protein ParB [Salinisphaera halophila YIM 95161]
MAQKKRGLGRGLESLLSKDLEEAAEAGVAAELTEVGLDALRPGRYQPRRDMDAEALESLAQSIRSQGVVQPLVVRDTGDGYEIVAGERRWRAARLAGLETVPAVVRALPDETAMAVALIENIQREDLNPLEEAEALRRLIEECGLTHAACAEAVGRSRAAVSNLLRLAELVPEAQALLRSGDIQMGHARALLGAPAALQADLAARVAARQLTVRQTEALVASAMAEADDGETAPRQSNRLVRFERELGDTLGARVTVRSQRGGRARVVIDYASAGELEALLERLK